MTKLTLLAAILLSGMLCLTGCGGSDSDDSGAVVGIPPVDPAVADNAAFAAVTPSGIKQTDKFIIAGRGTVFTVECSAISGATSYTFTTSFGATGTAATPSVGLQGTVADGDNPYTLSVYATNADGINTKTGSANVN